MYFLDGVLVRARSRVCETTAEVWLYGAWHPVPIEEPVQHLTFGHAGVSVDGMPAEHVLAEAFKNEGFAVEAAPADQTVTVLLP